MSKINHLSLENFGHRHIFSIAIPIIISNVTTPLVGFADIWAIGRAELVGDIDNVIATGAVAYGSMVFALIIGTLGFFKMGASAFTAQATGAKQDQEVAAILLRFLSVGILLGLLVFVINGFVIEIMLSFSDASQLLKDEAQKYFAIRSYGAPFTLMNMVILGWLVGQGRATFGLVIQLILNLGNVALNIYFVLILGWGVEGVAQASIAAEIIAFIISIIAIISIYGRDFFNNHPKIIFAKAAMKRMFVVNRDILLRSLMLLTSFSFFTVQSSNMGDVLLAANAILLTFLEIFAYLLDGFASASETFIGQSIGAKRPSIFKKAYYYSLFWAFAIAAFLGLNLWLMQDMVIGFMSQDMAIQTEVATYLIWPILAAIIGAWAYTLDGVYIGATSSKIMRNMMAISLVTYFIAWWLLTPIFDNHGLWLALVIMLFMRGFTLQLKLSSLQSNIFQKP